MKYEVLKRSYLKRNIIIGMVVVLILTAVVLTFTRAKYRVTQSVPLVSGTINFSPYDFNVVEMYLNKNGESIVTKKAPRVGYTLNEEQSTCVVDDEEVDNGQILFENGNLTFQNMNYSGTKCSVYFDLISDSENPTVSISTPGTDTSITVIADATDNIGIYYYYFKLDDVEEVRLEDNTYTFEGLQKDDVHTVSVRVEDAAGNEASASKEVTVGYKVSEVILASSNPPTEQTIDWTNDGNGETYYYTENPNNWIQFAGFWWRIIRINGDGTVRIIYQGTGANSTGAGTQIGTSVFNSSSWKTYVGLVYDSLNQHGYGTDSVIMAELNEWYNNNLKSYEKEYIDTGTGFCSDRNLASGSSWSSSTIYYAANDRKNGPASLQCNSEDVLSKDNGKLTNPIGLVTSDEVVLTEITSNNANTESYFYTGQDYWTMSPYSYQSAGVYARVFFVNSNGKLYFDGIVTYARGIRPVINLRSDIQLTGSGTTTDPFVVVTS